MILDGSSGTMTLLDASGKKVLRLPAATGTPQPVAGRAQTKLEARRTIRKGMTQDGVRRLLGEPDEAAMWPLGPYWVYNRLFGGRVTLNFRDGGRLSNWDGLITAPAKVAAERRSVSLRTSDGLRLMARLAGPDRPRVGSSAQ